MLYTVGYTATLPVKDDITLTSRILDGGDNPDFQITLQKGGEDQKVCSNMHAIIILAFAF